MAAPAGRAGKGALAPDEVQYYLQLMPLPATPVNQVYAFTIQVTGTILLKQVAIDGPSSGYANTPYTFSSVITPANAGQPITYTWQPAPGSQGASTATYQWPTAGAYTVNLTAWNEWSRPVTATHVITIEAALPTLDIYLPVVQKNP